MIPVAALRRYSPAVVSISEGKRKALSLYAHKRAKNSPGSITQHERGILGEYAVAKNLDIINRVDTNIYEYGDDGYDLIYRGDTIDVKTVSSRANNPELWVNARKPLEADWYVLVQQLNVSKYQIMGYAPHDTVEQATVRTIICDDYCDRVRAVGPDQLIPWPF